MNRDLLAWLTSTRLLSSLLGALLLTIALAASAAEERREFDHFSTGFPLTGAHVRADCASCHLGGNFKGTPKQCMACHTAGSMFSASAMPARHINSTQRCDSCHTTRDWTVVGRVDHTETVGSCISCHNNVTVEGKHALHPLSSDDCLSCHNTATWSGARFNHERVTGPCISCHDGVTATGKSTQHILTSNNCESCHTTRGWDTDLVDHLEVVGTCVSCHNGTTATGKHADHVVSGDTCDDCHTTRAWTPAVYDHSNVTDPCSTCHNGTIATGKDTNHLTTTLECDSCHTTVAWTPAGYVHSSDDFPGDHGGRLDCSDCHGSNYNTFSWPYPTYAGSCAGCHAGDYESEDEHTSLSVDRNCGRSGCHRVTDRDWD